MSVTGTDYAGRVAEILRHSDRTLIGGSWVAAKSGATLETRDPGTGNVLATVPLCAKEDVDDAVLAAQEALVTWRKTAPMERAAILWRIADLVEANIEELATLETLDTGKPFDQALSYDMRSVINNFRYMSGLANRVNGNQTQPATLPTDSFHTYTRLEPVGVIGAIVPWNFPLANSAWKIAPALACGNTVVIKPSEETPLTMLRAAELFEEAGVPAGVVNVITGDRDTGKALVSHPGVNKIAFTGSVESGRNVARAATDNLTKVSLELGGKSPNVIFADADIEAAILGAGAGAFAGSGQVCSAGSRVYVESSALDRVLEGMRKNAEAMPIGHGLSPETAIGPLISDAHREKVAGFVERGRHEGVEVAFGGEKINGEGYFYPPTAMINPSPNSELIQDEIFGPVVTVVPFDDFDEIVSAANDTSFGLGAGVWTKDISKAHNFANQVQAGVVWVNTYGMVDPALPWGGVKNTGWGRENGDVAALAEFTEPKAVLIQI